MESKDRREEEPDKVADRKASTIVRPPCHPLPFLLIAIVCIVTVADHPVTAHLAPIFPLSRAPKWGLVPARSFVLKIHC